MTKKKARILTPVNIQVAQLNAESDKAQEVKTVMSIFREIKDQHSHERLLTQLKIEFYDNLTIDNFSEDFFECMRYILSYPDRSGTETHMKFCVKFVVLCMSKSHNQDMKIKSSLLLKRFVKFISTHSGSKEQTIRFHSMQAARILLSELIEDIEVPEVLFERIQTMLLARFWDVTTYVRCEAAMASSRLQDPSDSNCPVVMGLTHLCKYDSGHTVRLAALQSLAITTKTLPAVIERVQDVSDQVRRTAFNLLTKWKILKPLSVSARLSIVEAGLTDRSVKVKQACQLMLRTWLAVSEDDLAALLRRLDVENREEVTEMALRSILGQMKNEEVAATVERLRAIMNNECLVVEESLCAETAFLWRHLVAFLDERPEVNPCLLEGLVPMVPHFEVYLRRLFQKIIDQTKTKAISLDEYVEYCTIVKYLLPLVTHLDMDDLFNRTTIISFIKWALSNPDIPFNYVEHLMKLFVHLESNNVKICDDTVEIINDLLFVDVGPTCEDVRGQGLPPQTAQEERLPEVKAEREVVPNLLLKNKEALRRKRIEIAQVDVKINELKEAIQTGMDTRNLDGLSQWLTELKGLEEHKIVLCAQRDGMAAPVVVDMDEESNGGRHGDDDGGEEEEAVKREAVAGEGPRRAWMEAGQEGLALKACIMAAAIVRECNLLWELPPSLRSLLDEVVMVTVTHRDPCVREKALLAMGLCCLLDREVAVRRIGVLLAGLEVDCAQVREVALGCLVDLFIRFGLEPFQEGKESAEGPEASSRLLGPLVALLEAPEAEGDARLQSTAAMGLSKLLYHGKIASPRLLARLLLLWLDPGLPDGGGTLRAHLGAFFTNFSLMTTENQRAIAASLLPALDGLVRAPAQSGLASVDMGAVLDFYARATDSRNLLENKREPLDPLRTAHNPCHDDLALVLCAEVARAPQASSVRHLVGLLARLRLSEDGDHGNGIWRAVAEAVAPLETVVRDRRAFQMLARLRWQLRARLAGPVAMETVNVHEAVNVALETATVAMEAVNITEATTEVMETDEDLREDSVTFKVPPPPSSARTTRYSLRRSLETALATTTGQSSP